MESKTLRQLVAIDRAGSISAAALGLGMAQPALSLALSQAERAVGMRLFKRSRRGVAATDAGRLWLDEAARVLAQVEGLAALGQRLAAGQSGRVAVGFISSALYEVLPCALAAFRMRYPNVSVDLREINSTDQLTALRDGQIDVGFTRSPISSTRLVRAALVSSEPLLAVVPEGFAPGKDEVTLEAISRRGLILAPETEGAVRARTLYALRREGIEPLIVQEAQRGLTMLSCVAAGLGVALMPSSVRRVAFRGVRYCRVTPRTLPTLDISVIWRPQSKPMMADRFVECVPRMQAGR